MSIWCWVFSASVVLGRWWHAAASFPLFDPYLQFLKMLCWGGSSQTQFNCKYKVSLYTFKALLDSTCSLEYPSSADESSKILVKHLFLLPVQQGSRRYFHHHNTLHSARVRWTVHDCSQEPCGKINAWTYPQSLQQCLLQWDKQVRLHLQMWSVSKYRGVKENWLGNGLSGLIVPELSALKLNYCLVTSSW